MTGNTIALTLVCGIGRRVDRVYGADRAMKKQKTVYVATAAQITSKVSVSLVVREHSS